MAKVDLDDVEKYMIGYVDSGKVRELIALFPDLIKELKAARECVEYLKNLAGQSKGSYALDGIPYREIDCLANYDEATK